MRKIKASLKKLVLNFNLFKKISSTDEYLGETNKRISKRGRYLIFGSLFVLLFIGIYWSNEPEEFSTVNVEGYPGPTKVGVTTSLTIIEILRLLLEKPGGLISNDIMPPGIWLDNIKNWEYGVIIQVRDISKAMRESFSRSQSQSVENSSLALAEPRFNVDHKSWAIPWPEREYKDGQNYVEEYLNTLQNEEAYGAQFFARADNLSYWLGSVEKRLGSLSQRLAASVGQKRINTNLSGDGGARQSTSTPDELIVKTGWLQIDDIFYEARGTSWALLHLLRAVSVDFEEVLINKNAVASLNQIIRELEMTQQTILSPVIVNGRGFGLLANHSLIMASYISRAHSALFDLRELLARG